MPPDAGASLPSVSVIIPSYNCASVLGAALDSIRAQGRQTEVVIVDDGSTDDTAAVVERFRAGSGLPVVYLPQKNRGPSAARNAGARQASGRYCVFLDADDRFLPEAFDRFEAAFRRHGEIDMIFGGFVDCPDDTHILEAVAAIRDDFCISQNAIGEVVELLSHLVLRVKTFVLDSYCGFVS